LPQSLNAVPRLARTSFVARALNSLCRPAPERSSVDLAGPSAHHLQTSAGTQESARRRSDGAGDLTVVFSPLRAPRPHATRGRRDPPASLKRRSSWRPVRHCRPLPDGSRHRTHQGRSEGSGCCRRRRAAPSPIRNLGRLAQPFGPREEKPSTSQGHAYTIFRRALERGNLMGAETTAKELPRLGIKWSRGGQKNEEQAP
jgi:hypothetical protein